MLSERPPKKDLLVAHPPLSNRSLPSFKGSEMPLSRPIVNKIGVSNAYFTLPNQLSQPDHLSPVKGESESSRSRNRTHNNTLAFHHLSSCQLSVIESVEVTLYRTYVFKTWKDREKRKFGQAASKYIWGVRPP